MSHQKGDSQSESKFKQEIDFETNQRGRRRREDRGLPSDQTIEEMAQTYLTYQHKLWAKLAKKGLLPPKSPEVVQKLAVEFKQRFLGTLPPRTLFPEFGDTKLAIAYARFSSDNSTTRSLSQQLKLILDRAAKDDYFIPWEFVNADAAITGMTSSRRGYELSKAVVTKGSPASCLIIDEIGRASRDTIEALSLGKRVTDANKRMLGVSDGFDSNSPMAKVQLSVFAAMQEWFIDQLRAKVNRGMDDKFDQGGSTGKSGFGYKTVPMFDQHGRPVIGKDGEQSRTWEVDAKTKRYVRLAFHLYARKGWSKRRIARLFTDHQVGGVKKWKTDRIHQMLVRHKYAGIVIYRMTRHQLDRETGIIKVIKRPRKDWRVRRARHLQIVPWKLWKATQNRIVETRAAFRENRKDAKPRTDLYPTLLIRPRCKHCNVPLKFGRGGRYQSLCCESGVTHTNDCPLRSYISPRIVERVILKFISEQILTEAAFDKLLIGANDYITQLSQRPKRDTKPLQARLKAAQKELERLYEMYESGGMELTSAKARIAAKEKTCKELLAALRAVEAENSPPPKPMDRAEMMKLADDLRSVLYQDVAAAATILRELTGPIFMEQVLEPGKEKPVWLASFSYNMVPVLAKLAANSKCPNSAFWEYLKSTDWIVPTKVAVPILEPKKAETLVDQVAKLKGKASIETMTRVLRTSRDTIHEALSVMSGKSLPPPKKMNAANKPAGRVPKYLAIASKVVKLRDKGRRPFDQIAEKLNVSINTVKRAYDEARPDVISKAVEAGANPARGRISLLSEGAFTKLQNGIRSGDHPSVIAEEAGCSVHTVWYQRKHMLADGEKLPPFAKKVRKQKDASTRLAAIKREEILKYRQGGYSESAIAIACGVSESTVREALGKPRRLYKSRTGASPNPLAKSRTPRLARTFRQIADEVVELHDGPGKLSFNAIRERFGCGLKTISRAYDFGRRAAITTAMQAGQRLQGTKRSPLSKDQKAKVREMLLQPGASIKGVATEVGCSRNTVSRTRSLLRREGLL